MILPSQQILDSAYVKNYDELYKSSVGNPEGFWEKIAKELFWYKPWDKVLDWTYPYAKWFVGGQTNIVANALDRHLKTSTKDKLAYIWVSQSGDERKFTYQQLSDEVSKFANGLKSLGVKKGDVVSIYLPRIMEQFIAMLACAKIGAVHSVVFSGFSSDALKNRIIDAEAKIVICTDTYPYKEKLIESKVNVDAAALDCPSIKHVIVVHNPATDLTDLTDSDRFNYHYWHELMKDQSTDCPTEIMQSTDPLFILYTSGSTGKPKGVVHDHGGYMVGSYITLKYVFNLEPNDIYFCTADSGWITGHSYIVYAPLINGTTTFVYEGTPDYPDYGIWWKLVEKYKITKFYTAPTAVRALMRQGDVWPNKYDLSSIKILGSVGEPINPEAWLWYYKTIGREKCPIMDTWWQTETGMFIITPIPSVPLKPGSAFKPFFGIKAEVVDKQGSLVPPNTQGYLMLRTPWPGMLMDVFKNPEKYLKTYFKVEELGQSRNLLNGESKLVLEDRNKILDQNNFPVSNVQYQHPISNNQFPDFNYFTGDSAKIDEDGYIWIIGRNDDVIKVSGHRLGSAELESAFVAHPAVAEAAVIGKPDDVKGEKIKAFVILRIGHEPTEELKHELAQKVRDMIGPIATPDEIEFVTSLPKTRSGKIMRRVLKAKELGQPLGDTSTLEN